MKRRILLRGAALAVGLSSAFGCSTEPSKEPAPAVTAGAPALNPNIQFGSSVPQSIRESMSEVYGRFTAEFGCAAPAGKIAVEYAFLDILPNAEPGITIQAHTEGNVITFNIAAGLPDKHEEGHEIVHACRKELASLDPQYLLIAAPEPDLTPIVNVEGLAVQSQLSQLEGTYFIGLDEAVAEIAAEYLYPEIPSSDDPKYMNWKALGEYLLDGSGVSIHDLVSMQQSNDVLGAASLLMPFNPAISDRSKVACMLSGFMLVRDGRVPAFDVAIGMQRDC